MAPRCFLVLMFLVFTVACSPDATQSNATGVTPEDARMLDKAATQLDSENEPAQTVSTEQ